MVISPTIKRPIVLMPQSARFASRSGCLLTLLAGSLPLRATPEGILNWAGNAIAGDVQRTGIIRIDLLDLPDNRKILRICQHHHAPWSSGGINRFRQTPEPSFSFLNPFHNHQHVPERARKGSVATLEA
jgi:hypothetical protein